MDENGLVEIPLYSGLRRCLDHFDIPGDSSSVCIMCSSRVVTLTRYLAFKYGTYPFSLGYLIKLIQVNDTLSSNK